MAHSIVTWLNTPDTWSIDDQDLTNFQIKHIIVSQNKMQVLSEDTWKNVSIAGAKPTAQEFEELGMGDISGISEEKWAELERPVEILTWTDKMDATEVNIGYNAKVFTAPELELTVPEYTLLDDLERPLSILTYTKGEEIPRIKQEFDIKNVGTRIMKRG